MYNSALYPRLLPITKSDFAFLSSFLFFFINSNLFLAYLLICHLGISELWWRLVPKSVASIRTVQKEDFVTFTRVGSVYTRMQLAIL